jgi:YVTN family beta-propeller protein
MSNDVTVLDLKSRKPVATIKVGSRPYVIAFAKNKAFVTNQGNASVSVIDLAQNTVTATVKVDDYPEGIEADDDEHFVYVSCWSDNTLVQIDAETLKVTGRVPVGDGPRSFGAFLR